MTITVTTEGRRAYITGDTYSHKDAIRAIGAKWDADRKAWWTGKAHDALGLANSINGETPSPVPGTAPQEPASEGDATVVAGAATYQGKRYYAVGRRRRGRNVYDEKVEMVTSRDGARVLLSFRDGSRTFWAAATDITIAKRYDRPQSISSLARYAARLRKSGDTPELDAARRRGWDSVIGSPSYYSSGAFDELDQ